MYTQQFSTFSIQSHDEVIKFLPIFRQKVTKFARNIFDNKTTKHAGNSFDKYFDTNDEI